MHGHAHQASLAICCPLSSCMQLGHFSRSMCRQSLAHVARLYIYGCISCAYRSTLAMQLHELQHIYCTCAINLTHVFQGSRNFLLQSEDAQLLRHSTAATAPHSHSSFVVPLDPQ